MSALYFKQNHLRCVSYMEDDWQPVDAALPPTETCLSAQYHNKPRETLEMVSAAKGQHDARFGSVNWRQNRYGIHSTE